jgi:hypothetical protein
MMITTAPQKKNNNQQMMVCRLDAVRNGGANEEGVRRGGRQQRKCNGAHPPIDKNWWGVSMTMMTKNTPQTNSRCWWLIMDGMEKDTEGNRGAGK